MIEIKRKARNRIALMLLQKGKKNKDLANHLKVGATTVSRWVTNGANPHLDVFAEIADFLDVDIHDLIENTKE